MLRRRSARFVALVVAAVALVSTARPVFSGPFVDLYVGGAATETTDLREKFTGDLFGGRKFKDVDFNTSLTAGARVGYWLSRFPYLGFGLDVFHFRPDIEAQNVTTIGAGATVGGAALSFNDSVRYPGLHLDVVGVSPELMLRWPLFATPDIPDGRLQPYITGGPTFFIAHMKDTSNFSPPSPQTDTDTSFGMKLGGGIKWQLHKHVAVFSEYRFTSFEPTFACHHNLAGLPHRDRVRMDLDTHHFVTGISIRF